MKIFYSDNLFLSIFEVLAIVLLITDVLGLTDRLENIIDRARNRYALALTNKTIVNYENITERFVWAYKEVIGNYFDLILKNYMTAHVKQLSGIFRSDEDEDGENLNPSSYVGGKIIRASSVPLGCFSYIVGMIAAAFLVSAVFPDSTPLAFLAAPLFFFGFSIIAYLTNYLIAVSFLLPLLVLILVYELLHLMDKLPGRSVSGLGLVAYVGGKLFSMQ